MKNEINSIEKLYQWMIEHCYNFNSYSIKGNSISEGFILSYKNNIYTWSYTERGQVNLIKKFKTEEEAVRHAFNIINNDKWAKSHLLGFTANQNLHQELIESLHQLKIDFFKDEIPYSNNNKIVYRTFVLGCNIKQIEHLRIKHLEKDIK